MRTRGAIGNMGARAAGGQGSLLGLAALSLGLLMVLGALQVSAQTAQTAQTAAETETAAQTPAEPPATVRTAYAHETVVRNSLGGLICERAVDFGDGEVTLQSRERIVIDSVPHYVSECTPVAGGAVTLHSTTGGCDDPAAWTHDLSATQSYAEERFARSAGYRAAAGQRVIRFDPVAATGSARYNPLAEVRLGSGHEIADCQNAALMIVDPEGKGLRDFWMQSAFEWLSGVLLHVLYRTRKTEGRTATLADVHAFMSVGAVGGAGAAPAANAEEAFTHLLGDMAVFEHGRASVDAEVRRVAGQMQKRAPNERSGVHSSASVPLALYADPIVAANTAGSDFRIDSLVGGAKPTSLYLVIPPPDIARLRPLIRLLVNQFLTRLTAEGGFEDSTKRPRRRLLLMLDEFTALGKVDLFEQALGFMAGYGLKAFIVVQDIEQLRKAYGRDESIMANCHVRIATAPNRMETAKLLSDMAGTTTVVARRRSRSRAEKGPSVSDSITETARALLTPDECLRLPGLRKRRFTGRTVAGSILIFVAGHRPILGRQWLYFKDRELKRRAALPPPGAQPPPAQEDATLAEHGEENRAASPPPASLPVVGAAKPPGLGAGARARYLGVLARLEAEDEREEGHP